MRTTTACSAFWFCVCCVVACSTGATREDREHAQGAARVGGEVVSTVDGVAITVADVQRLVDATGLPAREALSRLQSEALLSGEAQRLGFDGDSDVRRVERQARVQTLLARDIESLRASDREIASEYEKQHARFHVPELRQSSHVLARLPEGATPAQDAAARALAQQACRAFAENSDVDAVMQQFRALDRAELHVTAEDLPAVANGGSFVKPFIDALFAAPRVGAIAQPVRTDFGWHAIMVSQIVPAKAESLSAATPQLRKELETEKHRIAVETLVARLREETKVVEDDESQAALTGLAF